MSGHIRFTCPVAYGEQKIVPLINRFVVLFPDISVDIELTNRLLDIGAEGFDLAIRIGGETDERLHHVSLTSRQLYCCASPAYLDRYGTPSTIAQLEGHRCLQGSSSHWRFNDDGQDIQLKPHAHWRCNSGFAVIEAARSGLGLCQLPDFYVMRSLAEGQLVEVLKLHRPRAQEIAAVYPARPHQPSKVIALIEFIRDGL